ncbi:MAG: hypothetical protein OSJ72_17040 [Lachnospiraceae bacterium]|nr:hypothetical protein [Lachnospiraceae bacterium]
MAMPLVRPKIRGQKCKAGEKMPWKERAKEMYFESGMRVGEIAAYLEVSRQSVSGHIKSLPGYEAERERRRKAGAIQRRAYKNRKNQEYRKQDGVTGETLRREHDMAALILSREKY